MNHCQDCINALDGAQQIVRAAVEIGDDMKRRFQQLGDAEGVQWAEAQIRLLRESRAWITKRLP